MMNWKKILLNTITGFLTAWIASGIVLGNADPHVIGVAMLNGLAGAIVSGLIEAKVQIDNEDSSPKSVTKLLTIF